MTAQEPTTLAASPQSPLRVLVLCTGNICRSPLAEQMMRAEAAKMGFGKEFLFESAGVYAEVGQGVYRQSQAAAARFGFETGHHVARQLTSEMLQSADLVLTATAEHRSQVARQLVKANRYTFTYKEFVRISEFLQSDLSHLDESDQSAISDARTPADRVAIATNFRGFAPRPVATEDVIDPWGRSAETYDAVTLEIADLAARTVKTLVGA